MKAPLKPLLCMFVAGACFGPSILLDLLGAPVWWVIGLAVIGGAAFVFAMDLKADETEETE